MKVILLVALCVLLAAPTANAATMQVELSTNHPPEHKVKVPANHRTTEPLHVALKVKDFVCVTEATYSIDSTIVYEPVWAGVSLNPKATTVKIPQSEPNTVEKTYTGADILIDVFWDEEDRPKTDAEATYTISAEVELAEGGPCLPDPPEKQGDTVQITFRADDIVEAENTTGPNCVLNPDDPACIEPAQSLEPKGESPSAANVFMLAALLGALALRRRRL